LFIDTDLHSGLATSCAAEDASEYESSVDFKTWLPRLRWRIITPTMMAIRHTQATTNEWVEGSKPAYEWTMITIPAIRMVPVPPSPLELGDTVVVVSLLESDDDVAKHVYWPPCRFKHENPRGHGSVEHASLL
jgi:hypothetical protein